MQTGERTSRSMAFPVDDRGDFQTRAGNTVGDAVTSRMQRRWKSSDTLGLRRPSSVERASDVVEVPALVLPSSLFSLDLRKSWGRLLDDPLSHTGNFLILPRMKKFFTSHALADNKW